VKQLNNNSNIRYLSQQNLERFFSAVDSWKHKLMMRTIYESGCRVGEFVRIRLKHLDFENNSIFFPAENTKTRQARVSYISQGLMNELKDYLKRQGRITKRKEKIAEPESFLFRSAVRNQPENKGMTENRVRQIFSKYIQEAGLQRVYAHDSLGRALHLYTVHSLRHSHIMQAKHIYKINNSIVAKQVGHSSLQAMSAYDKPSDEMVKQAYEKARRNIR